MNSDNKGSKRVIGQLTPMPSAYTEEAVFSHPGGNAELRCVLEHNGAMYSSGLRFQRVRAYKYTAESHCKTWQIEHAYDTLVEIEESDWVTDLVMAEPIPERRWPWKIRHFLIYVDDAGAYEVAAEGFEWLPEELVR